MADSSGRLQVSLATPSPFFSVQRRSTGVLVARLGQHVQNHPPGLVRRVAEHLAPRQWRALSLQLATALGGVVLGSVEPGNVEINHKLPLPLVPRVHAHPRGHHFVGGKRHVRFARPVKRVAEAERLQRRGLVWRDSKRPRRCPGPRIGCSIPPDGLRPRPNCPCGSTQTLGTS